MGIVVWFYIIMFVIHIPLYFYFKMKKDLYRYFEYHITMFSILLFSFAFLETKVWIGILVTYVILVIANCVRITLWLLKSNRNNFYFIALYLIESFFTIIVLYAKFYLHYSRYFNKALSPVDAVYYSITTITTTGYGDIYPVETIGKILSNTEMILGYLYSAVIIALIVSKLMEIKSKDN